jgi:hypothetical protein
MHAVDEAETLPRNGHDAVFFKTDQVFAEQFEIAQMISPDTSASIAPWQVYS